MQKFDSKTKVISFADDTVLLIEGENWEKTKRTAENDLKLVRDFMCHLKLKLNENKTKFIAFTSLPKHQPSISLKIHKENCNGSCTCSDIHQVTSIKYLTHT